jgi:hypothetical protein
VPASFAYTIVCRAHEKPRLAIHAGERAVVKSNPSRALSLTSLTRLLLGGC